ncbi:MAG: hypothetical protein V3V95_04245 [Thermodesulfobacteriota bacterium]
MEDINEQAVINKDDFTFRWKGGAGKKLYLGFEEKIDASLDRLYKEAEKFRGLVNQK